jgi:hypothetical protein
MTELLMYEGLVSQILNLIVAEGARGGFEIANEYGEKSVAPLPWQFWYELDEQLIEQIFNRFFLSLAEKMKQLSASGNSTAIRKGEQLSFACEMLMNFQGSSPS